MEQDKTVELIAELFRNLIEEAINKHFKKKEDPKILEEKRAEKLISRKEAAENFGVTIATINKWKNLGILANPIKIGGRVYFLRSDIDKLTSRK